MKRFLVVTLLIVLSNIAHAQSQVAVNGMSLWHRFVDDQIEFKLQAPTTGWVGIGFNEKNDIVGADLLLLNIVNGKVSSQDMFVKGIGNPRLDTALGGSHDIEVISGKESPGKTEITFRLPINSADRNDFKLAVGRKLWLIMAYSTHDEFDHHSRMRRHIEFTL